MRDYSDSSSRSCGQLLLNISGNVGTFARLDGSHEASRKRYQSAPPGWLEVLIEDSLALPNGYPGTHGAPWVSGGLLGREWCLPVQESMPHVTAERPQSFLDISSSA